MLQILPYPEKTTLEGALVDFAVSFFALSDFRITCSFVPLQRYTKVFLLSKNPSVVILNSIWLDFKLDSANAMIERMLGTISLLISCG